MKTEKNILVAFLLNLFFSVFEFFGGIFTGSVAIVSDAVHDLGDATSIGVSYFLERKSKKAPDESYTYGYARYSAIGGLITTFILLFGSVLVIYNAVLRIITPTPIHYDGMILFAVVGVAVNFLAAFFTRSGDSLNQKAVNLHMLEDVLGWLVVLVGAIVMKFTNLPLLDPILSIAVALFIFFNAAATLKDVCSLFLEKAPSGIDTRQIKEHLLSLNGVLDVHHVHIWKIDESRAYATLHAVYTGEAHAIKEAIRTELKEHGIGHVTIELENEGEDCHERDCHMDEKEASSHHHHS